MPPAPRTLSAGVILLLLPAFSSSGPEALEGSTASLPDLSGLEPGGTFSDPYRIPPAGSAIGVDAILDEAAWQGALRLDLPYEVWPADNVEAAVRTEALLTYDATYLYAAFRARDPEPGAIRARLTDRDRAFDDDFVGVVLDTFNDERRAFEFFVNAHGVQMDLVQDDVAGVEDSSWDAIWHSAGRVTDEGYVVELAIPYTSLRFQRSDGDQTWGLDLVRIHPRDVRRTLAMNPRDRDVNCYLCQVSKIRGFRGAEPGRNLEITPTLTAVRLDQAPASKVDPGDPGSAARRFSDRGLDPMDSQLDLGLTAKWGMTPNLTVSGTVNPDFSQVEADVARLAVNERFALFFPEKRPFFLEGADFFSTPLDAVHTRTVVDPMWGTKLTGKEGRHAVGAFVAQDESTTLLFPGPQGSRSTLVEAPVTDGVFRYRRDMGEASAVGGLMTVREGGGNEYFNRVLGADALLRPSPKDTFRVQALMSQTRYPGPHPDDADLLITTAPPGDTRDSFGQPEGEFAGTAARLEYDHSVKEWAWWGWHDQKSGDFRADLGFLPQVGSRTTLAGAEYKWWGEKGRHWYTRLTMGGDVDETADHQGNLIEREGQGWIWFDGPMQSHLWFSAGNRRFGFRDNTFSQNFVDIWTAIRPGRSIWLQWNTYLSKQVDFAFVDPGDERAARQGDWLINHAGIQWNLGARLRTDLSFERRTLRHEEGRLFQAGLSQLNATWQMNVRTFLRAIVQHQDIERNTRLYPACVADPAGCGLEKRTRSVFTQFLFSYKVNPQTAVFLGYTDNRAGGSDVLLDQERIGLARQDRTLFFKIGYAFVQ